MSTDATEGLLAILDIGSTAVKAVIVAPDGSIVASGSAEHTTAHPAPGHVEQDPADWWAGACRALDGCGTARRSVVALGLTGQMQDLLLLGDDGPLLPAVLYSDGRATEQHRVLVERTGDSWALAVGALPDATNVAAKWCWLRAHRPDAAAAATALLFGGHSYVAWRATGVAACDPTTAATTGLLELATGTWWSEVLAAADLPAALLPGLCRTDRSLGALRPDAAGQLGLPTGIPVVHGPGDAVATTLGITAGAVDRPYAYLGTSGWVGLLTAGPATAPGVIVLPAPDDRWLAVAPILSAGATVDWVRATMLGGVGPAELDRLASGRCAAAEGVLLLPHLAGRRVPDPDPHASGAILGLTPTTDPGTIAAAALEGVAHALRSIAVGLGVAGRPLEVCGGGARSDTWCQVLADVLGATVTRVDDAWAGVLGVAPGLAAAAGLRFSPERSVREGATFQPEPGRSAVHRRVAPVFDGLADALGPAQGELGAIRGVAP